MVSQCCRATSRLVPKGLAVHETTTPVAMLSLGHRASRPETRRFRMERVSLQDWMCYDAQGRDL